MMKRETIAIADFYVPVQRRQILDPQETFRSNSRGSPHDSLPFALASSLCLWPGNRDRTRIPGPP